MRLGDSDFKNTDSSPRLMSSPDVKAGSTLVFSLENTYHIYPVIAKF